MKFLWISSNLRAFTRNKVQNYVVDDKQVNFTVFFFHFRKLFTKPSYFRYISTKHELRVKFLVHDHCYVGVWLEMLLIWLSNI